MHEITYQKALSKAAALCSKSEKCISDIRTKLFQWKLPSHEHDQIIDYLISEKFIDEERFARHFVRDKFRFNQWGRVKIRYHLSGKGIEGSLINEAIANEIDDEQYLVVLKKLAKEKLKTIKAETDFARKGKLMQFLSGRGFELDAISKILNE